MDFYRLQSVKNLVETGLYCFICSIGFIWPLWIRVGAVYNKPGNDV